MNDIPWDSIAKRADDSVAAKLAEAQARAEADQIEGFVLLYTYRNRKGAPLVHLWWRGDGHGTAAVGLMELAKATYLDSYVKDQGYTDAEADEVEPE